MTPDPFSDQMAADHRRDMDAQNAIDKARYALDELMTSDAGLNRLSPADLHKVMEARIALQKASAHIVAVWD